MKQHKTPFEFDSVIELLLEFPNDKVATAYFAQMRWDGKPVCPHCGNEKCYTYQDNRRFKCASCKKQFTAKSGTIFADTKIGMHKWFVAIYLLVSHKKGVSSHQLARDIKVTQKTAWFMLHRVRHALVSGSFEAPAKGVAQADEVYIGGLEKWKHGDKKTQGTQGRSTKTKTPVIGVRDGHGNVFAKKVDDTKRETVQEFIRENVAKGSILMTDEYQAYVGLEGDYDHRICEHKAKEYVSPWDTTTNGIENYWMHLRGMIRGTHHYVSDNHLDKYICAQSFRYNHRNITEWEKFALTLDKTNGKRLTYSQLKAA